MHFDPLVSLAGLIVGFAVGLTGMGGGALMTPVLVLLFHVQPLAAVSSDLVASMIMKPVGSVVHLRRRTANVTIARWLSVGAVPSAFAGVLVLRLIGIDKHAQSGVRFALGAALLVAATAITIRVGLPSRWSGRGRERQSTHACPDPRIRRLLTVAVGMVGGLMVG